MIGVWILRIASHLDVRSPASMLNAVAFTNSSLMSAPAQNAFSSPVMTRQRIASSSSRRCNAATSSVMTSSFSALRTVGRLIWTTAIGSSRVTSTVFGMDPSTPSE